MNRNQVRFLTLLLGALLLLTSCARLEQMDFEDDRYTNRETGISYYAAPEYYEAISLVEDGVAKLKRKKLDDLIFYQVDGLPSSMYLATESYELYCAEGVVLPELWEMNVGSMLICQTEVISVAFAEVTDAALLQALVDQYQNGTGFSYKRYEYELPARERYDLKFSAAGYPGIYYCLTYFDFEEEVEVWQPISDPENFEIKYPGVEVTVETYEGEELYAVYHFGTGIIYNRSTGRCVSANGLLDAYFTEDDTEASE